MLSGGCLHERWGFSGPGFPGEGAPEQGLHVEKGGGLMQGRGRGVPGREKGLSKGLSWNQARFILLWRETEPVEREMPGTILGLCSREAER